MRTSWADSVADSSAPSAAASAAAAASAGRSSYVPPHLRKDRSLLPSSAHPAASAAAPLWGPTRPSFGGPRDRVHESNPFANDEEPAFDGDNTGINFDAYEDIPVDTSGQDVPPPVNTFAEIDLGDALNENIRRCRYDSVRKIERIMCLLVKLQGVKFQTNIR